MQRENEKKLLENNIRKIQKIERQKNNKTDNLITHLLL